jgi:FkbM family methyltransferase
MDSFSEQEEKIYNKLCDDESKQIFKARILYIHTGKVYDFVKNIADTQFKNVDICYFAPYYERMNTREERKKIVIWGFGDAGQCNKVLLGKYGYTVDYIVDDNYEKINVDGVYSPEKFYYDKDNPIVVVSARNLESVWSIYVKLYKHRLRPENVYYEAQYGGYISGYYGNQYFDLPYMTKEDEEVFIDGGVFSGGTTLEFIKFMGFNEGKSIAFECDVRNIDIIKKNMSEYIKTGKLVLCESGLWSKKGSLNFFEDVTSSSSSLQITGERMVFVDSIDNVLNGQKATFIKLDIEGAELQALKGAEKTIKNIVLSLLYLFIIDLKIYIYNTVVSYENNA